MAIGEGILIARYAYCPDRTESCIQVGEWECWGLELPWANNKQKLSCIPEGRYPAKIGHYNKGNYPCVELTNVPGHTLIKIHAANWAGQLEGCIAPGLQRGVFRDQWGVAFSRAALTRLLRQLEPLRGEEFEVRITFDNRYGRMLT